MGRDRKKIKVKVYLPPYLDVSRLDESGYVELFEGATLRNLFKELRIPFPLGTVQLCRVNYEKARLAGKPPLKEGPLQGKSVPIEAMMRNYWKHFGWDEESGKPLEETIRQLGLDNL